MPTVLIVDDNPASFESLVDVLEVHELTAVRALSAEEALERIEQQHPDCILLDTVLPGMDGFQLCERLKDQPDTAAIPVIFLTGRRSDEAALVRALDLGAADYLLKPVRMPELIARIQAAIRDKAVHEAAVGERSTELVLGHGRRAYLDRAQEVLDRAAQLQRPVTCVAVGLYLPSDLTQEATPEQLTAIEEQLLPQLYECPRRGDLCAHLEECRCAFLLLGPAETGGRAVAERIRDRVTQTEVTVEGQVVPVSVAVGVAEASSGGVPKASELMGQAEEALSQAQVAGPGTVTFWSPTGPPSGSP